MMKKIIMVLMSMFFLFGTAGCDKQASKQASRRGSKTRGGGQRNINNGRRCGGYVSTVKRSERIFA